MADPQQHVKEGEDYSSGPVGPSSPGLHTNRFAAKGFELFFHFVCNFDFNGLHSVVTVVCFFFSF